ncbi:hypothetical protein SAMN06295900_106208 [Trinickia caryophylli]|uniref:Uncharacterized protein n=1 Tax=Trinickia caryophylli TaxID=28094 RepID=A0A1X7ERV0_TRICW|nr:hypothetical protein SAMN06295900_106208 [Trinickia caryophylli]
MTLNDKAALVRAKVICSGSVRTLPSASRAPEEAPPAGIPALAGRFMQQGGRYVR